MCQQCRKDKQRCLPQDRDWAGRREKCQRCAQLGHECGPSVRAQKRVMKKPAMADMWEEEQRWVRLNEDVRIWEHMRSIPSYDLSSVDSDFDSDASKSTWGSPPDESGLKGSIGTPRVLETRIRRIVAKLGDQNALRDLLRRDLVLCERVEQWVGESLSIRAAINAIIRAVQADFQHESREARILASGDLGTSRELILSELLRMMYRFSHPPSPEEQVIASADQKVIQQMLHISRKNRGIYSDADLICGNACGITPVEDTAYPATEPYIKASEAIKCVLSGLVLYDIEHRTLLQSSAYPSAHLAYIQGEENLAFSLWSASRKGDAPVDMFGRTLLHLAVYASDDQMLRRLLRHKNTAATTAGCDSFGMTPLQISACQDNVSCFSLMWHYGANSLVQDIRGRSVLALAARNGSQKVVASILQSGQCPPSLVPELCEAIEAGHESIADIIVAHYSDRLCVMGDPVQLEVARLAAEKAGFKEITKRLSDITARPPSRQAAITCLDNLDCNNYVFLSPVSHPEVNDSVIDRASGCPAAQGSGNSWQQDFTWSTLGFTPEGSQWDSYGSNTGYECSQQRLLHTYVGEID